jgi:diphthamide synthase (EF-2-diphthine--ammonia ligase)
LFPLWKTSSTADLARQMMAGGLDARLSTVDPRVLDPSFAGRRFDSALLADLPNSVDPCGERGEFHTCVTAGPMFKRPIAVEVGETVVRDGFAFADIRLA